LYFGRDIAPENFSILPYWRKITRATAKNTIDGVVYWTPPQRNMNDTFGPPQLLHSDI